MRYFSFGHGSTSWRAAAAPVAIAFLAACGGAPAPTGATQPGSASPPAFVTVDEGARAEPIPASDEERARGRDVGSRDTSPFHGKLDVPLNLRVSISPEGLILSTSTGDIAPGCMRLGSGTTIPVRGGSHDLESLTACAKRLKRACMAPVVENSVTIDAAPDVEYRVVIRILDALRTDGTEELFPNVTLSAKP